MADNQTAVKTMAEQIAKAIKSQIATYNDYNLKRLLNNMTIDGSQIKAGSISGVSLADGTITSLKVQDFEAEVARIAYAEIQVAEIDTANIRDGAITRAKIKNAAIDTAKIVDAAITHAKIGEGEIYRANIHDAAIGTAQIENASITSAKISELDAGKITSGTIDTQRVTIMNGSEPSFLWNSYGLYAYAENNGVIDPTTFVRVDKNGLLMQRQGFTECSLDWDGFYLGLQDGSVEILANEGFIVYDRPRGLGEDNRNPLVKLGRFGYAGNYEYGMRFYKTVNGVTKPTLLSNTQGDLWLEGRLAVGNDSDATGNIVIDGENKYIGTSKYTSGALGNGWRIGGDGEAVFNNITARGTLSATVFEYNKISSVGGSLYISPTFQTTKNSNILRDGSYYQITVEHPFTGSNHLSAGRNWKVNDVVSVQGFVESGNNIYEIRDLRCRISAIDNAGCILQTTQAVGVVAVYDPESGASYGPGAISLDGYALDDGAMLVYMGTSSGSTLVREGIYITANDANSPFIDVYDSTGTNNLKVRLGNLSGITDPDIQAEPLSGYGLYGQNVYLKGTFIADGGKIGNLTIAEIENNLNAIEIEITSSAGTIVKTSEPLSTTFTATVYRGNLPFTNAEYANYTILWWYSTNGSSWQALTSGGSQLTGRTISTTISGAYYVKCTLTEN